MKCYNHEDREAVAICAHCGKALCRECVTTAMESRLVCSEYCAGRVAADLEIIAAGRNKNLRQSKAGAYFFFVVGCVFAIAGVYNFLLPQLRNLGIFLLAATGVFFLGGVMFYKAATRKE